MIQIIESIFVSDFLLIQVDFIMNEEFKRIYSCNK